MNSHGTHRLAKGEIPHLNHFAGVFSQSNFHESERRLGSQRVESPDGRVAERLHLRVLAAQFEEDTSKGRIELEFWAFSGKPTKISFYRIFIAEFTKKTISHKRSHKCEFYAPGRGGEPLGGARTQPQRRRRFQPLEDLLVVPDVQHAVCVLKCT